MGLSSLPGLAAHKITPEEKKPAFDHDKASRLVSEAISLLSSLYPTGGLDWLRENRPDIIRHLKEAEANLDAAAEAEDVSGFAKALDIYTRSYQKAFELYKARPPIIEQKELF
jgi:hypothetical protein